MGIEDDKMITKKRKLFLFIDCKAFRTCDKELLGRYTDSFVDKLNEEELNYCLDLFKK